MLRLVGFFALAVLLATVLGKVPVVGALFGHGLLGILLTSALLSALLTRVGERLYVGRKLRNELRALAAVGSAYNHGKLGSLYLRHRQPRAAREHLEQAATGEPEVAEWHYRLGQARARSRDPAGALAAFERCVAIDEEHAYGAALLGLAQAQQCLGRHEAALAALARFEQNHGPSPESAFRRGRSLRKLRRGAEARAAFAEVPELARRATRYQRGPSRWWALRAQLARIV